MLSSIINSNSNAIKSKWIKTSKNPKKCPRFLRIFQEFRRVSLRRLMRFYLGPASRSLRAGRRNGRRAAISAILRALRELPRDLRLLRQVARQIVAQRALLGAGDGRRRTDHAGRDLTDARLAQHVARIRLVVADVWRHVLMRHDGVNVAVDVQLRR